MSKTGLEALLTPEKSVLLLIDHQPFQFASGMSEMLLQHGGGAGVAFAWESQLLATGGGPEN